MQRLTLTEPLPPYFDDASQTEITIPPGRYEIAPLNSGWVGEPSRTNLYSFRLISEETGGYEGPNYVVPATVVQEWRDKGLIPER